MTELLEQLMAIPLVAWAWAGAALLVHALLIVGMLRLVRVHADRSPGVGARFARGRLPTGDETYLVAYARGGVRSLALVILVKAVSGGYIKLRADGLWHFHEPPARDDALLARFVELCRPHPNSPAYLWWLGMYLGQAAELNVARLAVENGLIRGGKRRDESLQWGFFCVLVLVGVSAFIGLALPPLEGNAGDLVFVALYLGPLCMMFALGYLRLGILTRPARDYLAWLEVGTERLRAEIRGGRDDEAGITLAVAAVGGDWLRGVRGWTRFDPYLRANPDDATRQRDWVFQSPRTTAGSQ